MRREHRHELQTDELMVGLGSVMHWVRNNTRTVLWGGIGGLALIVVASSLLVMRFDRRDALRTELATLVTDIQAAPAADDEGDDESDSGCVGALPRLVEIADAEGGSGEGRTASYYAGICQQEAGDHEAAAASFDRARDRSDLLAALATYGYAGARRSQGADDEAAAAYRSLLADDGAFPVDAALYQLATLEEERGRREEALALYERLETEHADSSYRQLSDSRVAKLGGRDTE